MVSGEERLGNILLLTLLLLSSPTFHHPYNAILYGDGRGVEDAAPYGWVVDARCGIVMICIETGMFTYISATFTA